MDLQDAKAHPSATFPTVVFWAGQHLDVFTRPDCEEETEKHLVYELHWILGESWVLKS